MFSFSRLEFRFYFLNTETFLSFSGIVKKYQLNLKLTLRTSLVTDSIMLQHFISHTAAPVSHMIFYLLNAGVKAAEAGSTHHADPCFKQSGRSSVGARRNLNSFLFTKTDPEAGNTLTGEINKTKT